MQRIKILGPCASHGLDPRGVAMQSRVARHAGGDVSAFVSRARDRVLQGLGECCRCGLGIQIMLLPPQVALAMNEGDQGPRAVGADQGSRGLCVLHQAEEDAAFGNNPGSHCCVSISPGDTPRCETSSTYIQPGCNVASKGWPPGRSLSPLASGGVTQPFLAMSARCAQLSIPLCLASNSGLAWHVQGSDQSSLY